MKPVDISVTGVSKTFLDRTGRRIKALQNINLDIHHKETFCIVGPSGCGKSTLLRILLGLTDADEGSIKIRPERKAEGLAFIEQSACLLPWRTVLQNAAMGVEIRGMLKPSKLEAVEAMIREFGLAGFENSLVSELSGGMRQRVAVIRALASSPQVLICDEPFSAVDFVTRLHLNHKLKYLCDIEGITTLLVTHNIEEAIFLGDRIAVLSQRPGRIVNIYDGYLSIGGQDAVAARESPEFEALFHAIWNDLGEAHA